jgi:signal transduction histidine kinase
VTTYEGAIWSAGSQVPVLVTAGPLHGEDGRVAGAVFVLRDVRKERQAEQAKADLLATISHELRTPLTPIKGYAGMLRKRVTSVPEVGSFVDEIQGGVDRLERVIGQLVDFATVSGGALDLHLERVRVDELVDGALARGRAVPGGLDRVWRREVGTGAAEARIDRARVEKALDELVDNAVKYSSPGSTITLGAEVTVGDGNGRASVLRLRVTDTGEGLDTDRLGELAGGFSQGDGSATRRVGGLGIGLALADRIARAHGGALTCRSTPGAGATFTIVLPLQRDRAVTGGGRAP